VRANLSLNTSPPPRHSPPLSVHEHIISSPSQLASSHHRAILFLPVARQNAVSFLRVSAQATFTAPLFRFFSRSFVYARRYTNVFSSFLPWRTTTLNVTSLVHNVSISRARTTRVSAGFAARCCGRYAPLSCLPRLLRFSCCSHSPRHRAAASRFLGAYVLCSCATLTHERHDPLRINAQGIGVPFVAMAFGHREHAATPADMVHMPLTVPLNTFPRRVAGLTVCRAHSAYRALCDNSSAWRGAIRRFVSAAIVPEPTRGQFHVAPAGAFSTLAFSLSPLVFVSRLMGVLPFCILSRIASGIRRFCFNAPCCTSCNAIPLFVLVCATTFSLALTGRAVCR